MKIVFKVVIQKCEKSKNGFFQKLPDTICVRKEEKSSCTLSVLAKKCFVPKQCKPGKTIKIVVSAEIAQNQNDTSFWEKGVFWHGWKVGFTNCVFEKLCFFFWKHYFYCVFRETQLFKNKNYMLKNRKLMKTSGSFFWTWQKGDLFCLFLFQALMSLCFFLSGKIARVLKMFFFFPSFFGLLWGGLLLVYLGLEGLVVFVFLVFAFLVGVVFVCLLCFVLWLDVVVSVSIFVFFWFLFFCFLEGLRVRWGGSKGPPHLALNPPFMFLCFCFFLFCFCGCFLFFLEGLRVRWGGPKGHLTWPLTILLWFFCVFCLVSVSFFLSFLCFK